MVEIRKAITTLLCVSVVLMGALVCSSPAVVKADEGIEPYADTSDTPFWFDLGDGYSTTAGTTGRLKEDDTPLYFYPSENFDIDMFYIYAQGSYNQTGGR